MKNKKIKSIEEIKEEIFKGLLIYKIMTIDMNKETINYQNSLSKLTNKKYLEK